MTASSKTIDDLLTALPSECFSDAEAATFLRGSTHSRYSAFKRAFARGDLIHLRRGLYCRAGRYRQQQVHPFVIAQRMYGPSAISFESALSFHGWIPEGVQGIASASIPRSQSFETPLGIFSFRHTRSDPFYAGVKAVSINEASCLIAHPWKAIADYIAFHKKEWKGIDPLIHDLRIDEEQFESIDTPLFEEIVNAYRHDRRVQTFFHGVRKDLHL